MGIGLRHLEARAKQLPWPDNGHHVERRAHLLSQIGLQSAWVP